MQNGTTTWTGWTYQKLCFSAAIRDARHVERFYLERVADELGFAQPSGVIAVAIGLAAARLLAEWHFSTVFPVVVATHFLIQVPVLMVWLAWGPLLPHAASGDHRAMNKRASGAVSTDTTARTSWRAFSCAVEWAAMKQFSIRDLLLLVIIVALGLGWWLDKRPRCRTVSNNIFQ